MSIKACASFPTHGLLALRGEHTTISHCELRKALSSFSASRPGSKSVTSRNVGRMFFGKSVRPLRFVGKR